MVFEKINVLPPLFGGFGTNENFQNIEIHLWKRFILPKTGPSSIWSTRWRCPSVFPKIHDSNHFLSKNPGLEHFGIFELSDIVLLHSPPSEFYDHFGSIPHIAQEEKKRKFLSSPCCLHRGLWSVDVIG